MIWRGMKILSIFWGEGKTKLDSFFFFFLGGGGGHFYATLGPVLSTQVNRMFKSRRVLAIGGKHCDFGWTGSVFINFYVL